MGGLICIFIILQYSLNYHLSSGQIVGGAFGLYEGLKNPEGTTPRLRFNCILNGLTKRGPAAGNAGAVAGLITSITDCEHYNMHFTSSCNHQ
jgi:hypothetical protein